MFTTDLPRESSILNKKIRSKAVKEEFWCEYNIMNLISSFCNKQKGNKGVFGHQGKSFSMEKEKAHFPFSAILVEKRKLYFSCQKVTFQ